MLHQNGAWSKRIGMEKLGGKVHAGSKVESWNIMTGHGIMESLRLLVGAICLFWVVVFKSGREKNDTRPHCVKKAMICHRVLWLPFHQL